VGTGAFARPAKRSEASRDHDSRGFMPNFAESFAAKATGTSALPIQIYLASRRQRNQPKPVLISAGISPRRFALPPKRGDPVSMSTNSATPPPAKVLLGCSKCGASLPDEAQFCLKCGKPVSSPAKSVAAVEVPPAREIAPPRPKRRTVLWILLAILVAGILWAAASDNPFAQQIQEFVGFKQDRIILDSAFSVGPRTFRYYKFALPEGSVNVTVVGHFNSAADGAAATTRKSQIEKNKTTEVEIDNNIEAYVLTEPAFTVWQNGYATSSLYESGKVAEATVQADVPAGAGIYYLVFSNKSAPKTPKAIHATVLLRYKSWLPDSLRRLKARFWDWVGA
jgi:hypothetical protein